MDRVIKEVVVCSGSMLKIRAIRNVFEGFYPLVSVIPCKVDSGVGDHPIGMSTMKRGACARVRNAKGVRPGADLYIAIESGFVHYGSRMFGTACAVVDDGKGEEHFAFGAQFPVPGRMVEEARTQGIELGEVARELTGGGEKDLVTALSNGFVLREELIGQALRCALVPVLFSDRYNE